MLRLHLMFSLYIIEDGLWAVGCGLCLYIVVESDEVARSPPEEA